jgi:hypothetical protein
MMHDAAPSSPYRVRLLDAVGRVLRTKIIQVRDEAEALQRAHAFMDGRSVELWKGDRLILRLAASDTAAA